ncbi:hypothetical protein ACMXYV_14500 [Neptuniibacter sp. SY11_33]|uniref:hypothetical protein n=1 Tax=Neptuniibacter sp. SY11_33 TaxID=3398215 RepID=UPI0039F4F27E
MQEDFTFKFAGKFYFKVTAIGFIIWVGLNFLFGNSPFGGQYYVPFFLCIVLLVQRSYKLNIRDNALFIKRFGLETKASLTKVEWVEKSSKKLILHMLDGAQHHLPLYRYSPEDQARLIELTEKYCFVGPRQIVPVPQFSQPQETQEEQQENAGIQTGYTSYSSKPDIEPTYVQPTYAQPSNHMSKQRIKSSVTELLNRGVPKREVFEQLRNSGVTDTTLATLIAATPDEILNELHEGKNKLFVTLFMLTSALAIWGSYVVATPEHKQVTLVISLAVSICFTMGFLRRSLLAYNFYLVLCGITIGRELFACIYGGTVPIPQMIGIALSIGLLLFAWFIRTRLYPDFRFFGVKKGHNGEYVFTD